MAQYTPDLDAFTLYHKEQEERTTLLGGPSLPALGNALAGSTGSAFSNVAVYPLSVIITRLQLQHQLRKQKGSAAGNSEDEYHSVLDTAAKIYKKEGLAGFYTGCPEDTGKTVIDSFLFFLAYNFLRDKVINGSAKDGKMPVGKELGVGMLAAAFSKFWTTPIATVVTRLQAGGSSSNSDPEKGGVQQGKPTFASIIKEIREEKGILGFWSGYPQYLILTINPSLSFFFFEAFKRILVRREDRENSPPHMTFIMAAMGKALASAATYPFSLVKARKQAEKKSSTSSSSSQSENSEPSNIFQTVLSNTPIGDVLSILKDEGPGALYEGLMGEVMKGFFSQGITMTLKDSIHVGIIQMYYAILKLLKKYPAPTEAVQKVGQKVNDAANALNPYPTKEGARRAQYKGMRAYPSR